MKTPRELLLARHQAANAKLDVLRREIVARQAAAPDRPGFLARLWLELIWPCRRTWTGLAAVWLLIIAANLSLREPRPALAQRNPEPQIMMSYQVQEKMLNDLLADRAAPPDVERPRFFKPGPRSESFHRYTV